MDGSFEGGEVGRDVSDLLFRKPHRMRPHGGMTAFTGLIGFQGRHDIFRMLPAQFRHMVGRIDIGVAGDTVASKAGPCQSAPAFDYCFVSSCESGS